VRFLLDQNQSPLLVELLAAHSHDVVHVRDRGLSRAPDSDILEAALAERRTVISADTDFGEILARSNAAGPSIVLFRRQGQRRAAEVAALLLANLPAITEELDGGAVVVFDADRVRVRRLPMEQR
jgi:predicted nuclease of predicted toxin-antitoxin system